MQDCTALVTGATGGIGREIAGALIAAGAKVLLVGRSAKRLRAAVPALCDEDGALLVADLTDAAAIAAIGASVARRGRLDALILSSGVYARSDDPQAFRRQVDANVLGPHALIRTLLPTLLLSRGQVVFINSSQALRAAAGVGPYAATMHAMKAVADSLREEVNAQGVRVSSLYLGRTAGERQRAIFALEGRAYPPERLIQPADVARLVVHLLQMPPTAEVTDLTIRPMLKT